MVNRAEQDMREETKLITKRWNRILNKKILGKTKNEGKWYSDGREVKALGGE